MGLRYMPPRGGSGAPRLRRWRGFLSAAFRACHALVPAFLPRASAAGGLLLAVLLAAMPLHAVAQTQGVSISVDPAVVGRYSSIHEGKKVTFTVNRTGDNSDALTVTYVSMAGGGPDTTPRADAVEGDDYTAIPESHTFPAGGSTTHEFSITINDDDAYEPNQYFTLTVSGSYQHEGNTIEFNDDVTVRIRENDERYLILSPVLYSAVGSSNPEFMAKEGGTANENRLTISLNEPLPYDLDIKYTVGDDPYTTASAASDKDFKMANGTATIPDGETSVTIDIRITDDQLVEPTEYFTLGLRTPDYDDPGNALGTFNQVNFQESKVRTQPLCMHPPKAAGVGRPALSDERVLGRIGLGREPAYAA